MHRPLGGLAILPRLVLALAMFLLLLHASNSAAPALAASTADLEIVSVIANQANLVPGATVTYTITYRNNGPGAVPDAVVSDTIPAAINTISYISSPAVSASSGPPGYAFQLNALASGASGTITIQGTVSAAATASTVIANSASITAPALTDATPANNSSSANITVIEPTLTLAKTLLTSSANVDAGDTVQYQIRVSPTAGSTADAYSVDLTDDMPAGIPNFIIVSALITDGATSSNVAGNFAMSGSNDLVTNAPVNLLLNTNGANDQVLTIVVAGNVRDAINPGGTIANAATATWRAASGVQKGNYLSTGFASTIIVPSALSVTKSIAAPGSSVTPGQVVTYQLDTTLIEGTTNNMQWRDTLPVGMTYVPGSLFVSNSNGMTVNDFNATLAGQTLTIGASSVVNPGNVDNAAAVDSDSFSITYQASVNDTNTAGTILTNDVDVSADPGLADNNNAVSLTIVEPALTVAKTLLTSKVGVDAGDTMQYQIRVSPTAGSTADAYALDVTDDMPAGLQNVTIVSALVTDGVTASNVASKFSINGSGDLVTTGQVNLLLNTNGSNDQELTIIVAGTVRNAINPGGTIANAATVRWETASGVQKASYTSTSLSPTITVPSALSVTKSIITPASGPVNSGDVVTYQLATTVIEGSTNNMQWVDTLPAGMTYVPGSLTVSNGNGMTVNGLNAASSGQVLTISASSVVNPGNVDNAAAADSDSFSMTYQAHVSPSVANGSVLTNDVDVSADPGLADNNNSASVTVINVPPQSGTLSAPNKAQAQAGETSAAITLEFTANVAIDVSSIDSGDLTISGPQTLTLSSASFSPAGDGTPRTATYSLIPPGGSWDDSDNGTYTISIVASQVFDIFGRSVAASTVGSFTVNMDTTAPTTQIDSSPAAFSNSTAASFSFSGTDATTPAGSLSFACQLDGGGFSACTSPQSYTSLSAGAHTFQVRASDSVGNTDSTPASFTWQIDLTAPTVAFSSAAAEPTNLSPIAVTATFSENVTGFTAADITPGNGTVSNFAGSGSVYTFELLPSGQGLVTADIAASAAQDAAGNDNTAATQFSRTYDSIAPAVTINQASAQADPTGMVPINFAVTFDEPVTGFGDSAADVTITGTAGATSATVTGSGTTYNVAISGMTAVGTVLATIPAGAAQDLATNPSAASTSTDNSVSFDPVGPFTTGIVRADPSPTSAASLRYTVTFAKSAIGVDASDFAFTTSGLTGASVTSVTGGGKTWTVTVDTGSGDGMLRLDLVDDDSIVDVLGNPLGGVGTGNGNFNTGEVYQIDKTAPVAALNAPDLSNSATTIYTFTVVYSDNLAIDIDSLGSDDLRVSGPGGFSQLATLVVVSPAGDGSPRTATYQITAPGGAWDPTDNGIYTVSLMANTIVDSVGNATMAGTLGTFEVKRASANRVFLPLVMAGAK